jgi:hypothetical protein
MVTKKFEEIVENAKRTGSKIEIKVALKNRLLFARDIASFNEMIEYVQKKGINLYEEHDNKSFPSENSGQWNDSLLDKEINNLLDNFSKERISNIRKLIAKLENKMSKNDNVIKSKATNTQIPNVSPKLNSKKRKKSDDNFTKNIGIGLTAVGGLVTVTSLFTGLGVKTLVGVAIAGAGIIILVSENK